eukprot:gene27445-34161_t
MGMREQVDNQINQKIVSAIDEAMKRKIGELIPVKLAEKGVEVDCETRFAEDQADFFFDMLERLGVITQDETSDNEDENEGEDGHREGEEDSSGDDDYF